MKHRVVSQLVALVLLLSLAGAASMSTSAAVPDGYVPVGPGDVYLALGNSLVTGTEDDSNNDEQPGYPAFFHQDHLLPHYPNLIYENIGKDGESSTSMINEGQLAQAEAFIASERAAGRRVGLVTLDIGGNDFVSILPPPAGSSADPSQSLATFTANLDVILQRLVAALTVEGERQGDLLIMDYYNPYPGIQIPPTGETLGDTWVPQFNAAIKAAAAQYGIPVAEVEQAFSGNESQYIYVNVLEQDFDYHPTPAGHQEIARQFMAVSGYTMDTPIPPESVQISGPDTGTTATAHTFTATANPVSSTPLTYTWSPEPASGQGAASAAYTWSETGVYTVNVAAGNSSGTVTDTHPITIALDANYTSGAPGSSFVFRGAYLPPETEATITVNDSYTAPITTTDSSGTLTFTLQTEERAGTGIYDVSVTAGSMTLTIRLSLEGDDLRDEQDGTVLQIEASQVEPLVLQTTYLPLVER